MIRPLERFIHVQAASGVVLLLCAAIALGWANSRWGATYEALWETHIQAAIGPWTVGMSLHTFVNDVLMAVFFFVIGLEIRREIHDGELGTLRSAALPVFAALGGMAVPTAIYVLIAPADARQGWAVPVSTDTAFALGILALLGARVAPSLRVLLLAVAVIDDILAITIIAIFYSSGLNWVGIVVAFIGLAAILGLQRLGVRHAVAYAAPSLAVWGGCWHAGIHPTVAGIIIGLLTPARIWYGHQAFVDVAYGHLATISRGLLPNRKTMDVERPMSELRRAQREAVSPVERIETAMHAWAAFAIMPIFALANAGIDFARVELDAAPRLVAGIVAGLVVGKLAGIVGAVRLGVALGIAQLPPQVTWRGIVVLAAVAGVGFTMALFIANLAFGGSEPLQDVATIAVLVASAMSGLLALLLGLLLLRKPAPTPVRADGPLVRSRASTHGQLRITPFVVLQRRVEPKHEHARTETDEKLRAERGHTDEELLKRSTALGGDADHVIERARARARTVLDLARRREDEWLEGHDASCEERGSLANERRVSDHAVKSAQVEADATRRDERSLRIQALLQLLAAERDETDRTLASERWMSDKVVAAHDDAMAGITHDLRGHLGVLLLGTSTIISDMGENPEVVRIAGRMQRSIGQMNALVTDLLDVASMAADALLIRPAPTDLVELVDGALEIIGPTAEARRIQVVVQLPNAPLIVQADAPRVTRALVNVLGNALKFTPPEGRVTVTLVDVGDEAEVSIADTGPGIPNEKLETVFERFERVDPNARASGHGLGLYITRAIVNAHGGRIWVESTLHQGSTFHLRLPQTQKLQR